MGWSDFRDKALGVASAPVMLGFDVVTGGKASKELGFNDPLFDVKQISGGAESVAKDLTGETARDAAAAAAEDMRISQMDELSYLKEINKLPQQYKEEALTKLRNLSTPEGQQAMIDQTKASPMYTEMMAGREAGEEGVARAASVTGGFRSGNVNEALYDYNVGLENRALTQGYQQQVSGLEGLAGIITNEQGIADTMGNISSNQMQSRLAQAQMKQQGTANLLNFGLGIGGMIL